MRHPKSSTVLLPLLLVFAALAAPLDARVISYAPVTSKRAIPAVQRRTTRHYLLVELDQVSAGPAGPGPIAFASQGHAVLYDSRGEQPPRVLLPSALSTASFVDAAMWEGDDEKPQILLGTDAPLSGDNQQRLTRYLFSPDGGATWSVLPLPQGSFIGSLFGGSSDLGGPITGGQQTSIRLGSAGTPFVAAIYDPQRNRSLYAISSAGTVQRLAQSAPPTSNSESYGLSLAGSNAGGTEFLVRGTPLLSAGSPASGVNALYRIDLSGTLTKLLDLPTSGPTLDGWIAPSGAVYLHTAGSGVITPTFSSRDSISILKDGVLKELAVPFVGVSNTSATPPLWAIPTNDFSGAWILQRGTGFPTVLSRHQPGGAVVEQWRDGTGPEVEALHAGDSGERLLIQVHRPRPQADQRIFRDPALAVWTVGTPAPRSYDELFLDEQQAKGFVHLDVDAVAAGEPFVFSSGVTQYVAAGGPSSGGGADVSQEWGVVRGSLKQRLVIPAVARMSGYFSASWRSDVLLRNPSPDPLAVSLRFVASETGASKETAVTLAPYEIRVATDILSSLFAVDAGSGALFLTPESGRSLEATSRTYTSSTSSTRGSYGMGVGAIDLFASAGPRFPFSFSGALLGPDFRTNLIVTDASGRGEQASVTLFGDSSAISRPRLSFLVPAGGPTQLNGLGEWFGVPSYQSGAIVFQPESGDAVAALFVIDNRTNDPTYFPPDLSSGVVRTIPAIVHADGANSARFRSDLFLFNTSDTIQSILLAAKLWSSSENETLINLTLLPKESKTIRDVLFGVFGKSGVARLRYSSSSTTGGFQFGSAGGVRVTSRTYTVDPTGGTYGLLVPPLNSFQSAGPGDSLEILGPRGGDGFRTNLSLVELTAFADGKAPKVRIEIFDETGRLLDTFESAVPTAGGVQLDDIFHARGLGARPVAALIRVSPAGGMVGAYATMIDNGTNDPTYFPASLAAR